MAYRHATPTHRCTSGRALARRAGRALLGLFLVSAVAVSAAAQQRPPANQPAAEPPKPLTRAEKAQKLYSDASSLWQTGRRKEAAPMFESLARQYPTSELVPRALAKAIENYIDSGQDDKAEPLIGLMKKNFPNCQYTVTAYWYPIEAIRGRETKPPLDKQIAMLEEYLDRYWAQWGSGDAVEKLTTCLLAGNQVKEADALLAHALEDTLPEGMGYMINMVQRACWRREDAANMAKIYEAAVKNIDPKAPATAALRLLEMRYLTQADVLDKALAKTELLMRDRPRSEYAAYCALELKPSILARGKKPGEAAAALRQALEAFKIFALPQHWEKLAAYEAEAGRTQQAVEILNKRLSETNWPIKQLELLNLKHNHQMKAGDLDGANATNKDIAQRFPGTRVAVSAELRTAGNLLGVKKFQEARSALSTTMKTYAKDADLAAMLSGAVNDCVAGLPEAEGLALREEFIATYPASAQADDYRKALKLELKDTATVQAKALFDEYRSFAKENNVDAARRRIDRLFAEFPTSSCGADAAAELAAALKKADKVELAAELNLLVGQKCPYRYRAEELLRDAADSYNGAAKPDLALKAYDLLVKGYRTSQYWRDYVLGAAATLDKQGKVEEIRTFLNNVAEKLGDGPEAVDLKAYMARRLEAQNKWVDAAYEMLKIMGPRAADPAYRPLTGEAFMYVYVGQLDDKEIKLLDDLAAKYEGWDEADRIRISLAGSYARKKETAQALKMLRDIAKRHPNYEMGATGQGMVQYRSQYERGLFWGTVGRHPVERVEDDMSGGWGNYLYAATIEDMVDYVLLLNEPQAYVDRVTQRLGQLMNAKSKRPQNYKSGLPYRTKNVPKPRWHPWPEQRKCYLLAVAIDDGLHHMTRHVDPAVWLEVYPLWPHYFLNDERITDAAGGLVTNKPLFQRALAILKENYNPLTWEPYILNAMAGAERQGGSSSVAAQLYRELFTRYPDHELAANAAKAFQDLGGRV